MNPSNILYTEGWENYSLLDAGGGKKLERWGEIITIRPERQAYFHSGKSFDEWQKLAHFEFIETSSTKGHWKSIRSASDKWGITYSDIHFELEKTPFKHIGLFPEQRVNWDFILNNLKPNHRMLNLFAYTGASSLMARKTGAEVIHVDSLRQLIDWSNRNMQKSGLEGIKWVCEDALKFSLREVKRGNKYDLIQMDPPAFGLGSKSEKWFLEQKIEQLIQVAHNLLNPNGWLILNTYSPKLSGKESHRLLVNTFGYAPNFSGELWMKTESNKKLYYGDLFRIQKV